MGSDNIQTSELEKRSISTPLFFVAFCGFSGLAKHLIITRALDVNAKVHNDWTPLFAASHVGHVDVVQLLLDYGSDVNALDIYDQSPLHMASFGSHVNVVQLLLEHGANVNTQDNYDCYTLCIGRRRRENLRSRVRCLTMEQTRTSGTEMV